MGIEPTRPAWKAGILPLNYTRINLASVPYQQRLYIITLLKRIVKHFLPILTKKINKFFFFYYCEKNVKKCEKITLLKRDG